MNHEDGSKLSTVKVPVVTTKGMVLFPRTMLNFEVKDTANMESLKRAMEKNQMVFVVAREDKDEAEKNRYDGIYRVGVFATIKQVLSQRKESIRVLVEGNRRGLIKHILQTQPYVLAEVMPNKAEAREVTSEEIASLRAIKNIFSEYARMVPQISPNIVSEIELSESPEGVADFLASNIIPDFKDKQNLLSEGSVVKRIDMLTDILMRELDILSIEENLNFKLMTNIKEGKREYYLREQKKLIEKELGEDDLKKDADMLFEKISKLDLPNTVSAQLAKECNKMSKMQFGAQEAGVLYNYIDLCIDLPWNAETNDDLDLKRAQAILDRDHYGMAKVKDRILEALAVKKLTGKMNGQIICLVGPPGVGKTSIAKSIAEAVGRKYVRISLGGIHDEADIRGHRKTYVGAMPGRIILAVKKSGSKNALILLDEIDKLGKDIYGDPVSALLEVLDEEQNSSFYDHYVDMPFDLSNIFFVTTANSKEAIPEPLLDRMEIINLTSYTLDEKLGIAKRHLIPKQLKKHGMDLSQFKITDSAVKEMIEGYTHEAGVRELERTIASILRKLAKNLINEREIVVSVNLKNIKSLIGQRKYNQEDKKKKNMVGVCSGLAWTHLGGEMISVEASIMPGSGKIELTGSLGKVMKESARTALSYIRSNAERFNITSDFYNKIDVHIHVPQGSVPKDGPSAGVTIATAMVSALTDIPVKRNVSMTGEITLRGRVLPVGGLKEKIMAAHRSDVETIIVPKRNEQDVCEMDASVLKKVRFIFAQDMMSVIEGALVLENGEETLSKNVPLVNAMIENMSRR